jgi:hypothetical protein
MVPCGAHAAKDFKVGDNIMNGGVLWTIAKIGQ